MVNRLLIVVLFMFLMIGSADAQKLPAPINMNYSEFSGALLPDSSVLVASSGDKETYKAKRFVYNGTEWLSEPNQLTELINGVIYEDSHVHFRFSNDFTRFILILHGAKNQHIYLTEQNSNGKWTLFRDIIDPSEYSYFNFTPSFSSDNSTVYLSDLGKKKNTIWCYTDTQNFTQKVAYEMDKFDEVHDVIGIGERSILTLASLEQEKALKWFYLKQFDEGEWSVPYVVKELDFEPFALSVTPFNEVMMYANLKEGDLYLTKTPEIIRQDLEKERAPATPQPGVEMVSARMNESDKDTKMVKPDGQYYALLIGNADYKEDALDLGKPREDVQELKSVLNKYYSFDSLNILTLEDADRETIFSALYQLRTKITPSDNLLIFYAGHGFWDEQVEQGYWWPSDATPKNPSNWLSNSDLREQIRGINSAHTLLISDACFSGGIFKTRGGEEIRKATTDIQLLYRMPSRRAMTSGTLSTVPDNSVFFNYLLKYLKENESKFLPSTELFTKVRRSVLSNSLTVPQDGVIMGSGDEGGDFIFIKRN